MSKLHGMSLENHDDYWHMLLGLLLSTQLPEQVVIPKAVPYLRTALAGLASRNDRSR